MKTNLIKIRRMQQKQCLEGNLQYHMHMLKEKKDLNLSFHLKKLEKEEQIIVSRRKEVRIRAKINEIENRKLVEKNQ